jgi:FKBP-type peptidyl-prolyl isomerase-like protein
MRLPSEVYCRNLFVRTLLSVKESGRFRELSPLRAFERSPVLLTGGLLSVLLALVLPVVARGFTGRPTHGPLSEKPTIKAHKGPAPKRLMIKDIIKGHGPMARNGDVLTVNYVGALYRSDKVFDSSWHRDEPFAFTLGKGTVIEGWERGFAGMRVGGRRELIIPAALAYGNQGSPPTIPPDSTLIFVVDLLAA